MEGRGPFESEGATPGAPPVRAPDLPSACDAVIAEVAETGFRMRAAHGARARGVLYYSAGLPERAARAFEQATRDDHSATNLYLLGVSCAELKQPILAAHAFECAIAADSTLVMAYFEAAQLYRSERRAEDAMRVLQRAIAALGQTTYASYLYNELALAYEMAGRLEEAAGALRRAIELHGARRDGIAMVVNLAAILYKLERLVEAKSLLEGAMARGASHATQPAVRASFLALYILGSIESDLGNASEACRLLERAVELRPDAAGAWNRLAVARDRAGDGTAAISDCRRALRVDPHFAPAERNLARLERRWSTEAT